MQTPRDNRLIRALQRGGMVVLQQGRWAVCRTHDSRQTKIGELSDTLVEELMAEGLLANHDGHSSRLIWFGGKVCRNTGLAAPPDVLQKHATRRSGHRRGLLEQAIWLQACEHERFRLLKAASRFNGDAEQAATPASITMGWEGVRVDHSGSGQSQAGPGSRALKSAATLDMIQNFIGDDKYAMLHLILVTEVSRAGLARRMDIAPRAALKQAGAALVSLADAYDAAIPAFA